MPTNSNASFRRASCLPLIALAVLLSALACLGAAPVTAAAQADAVTYWDQPELVNPMTITVSDTNRTLNLSPTQDYIVGCPSGGVQLNGKLTVWGGHNVVFQNCSEYVANTGGDWAADFQNQTGTVWIHDVHFGGEHLTGGIQLQEPGAAVVLRDVLFDQVTGSAATNHAECIQTWSGPDRFLIDGLTCNTTYQGLFLQPNQYGGATPTVCDFRNVDVYGEGAYDLWLADVGPGQVGQLPDLTVQNTYDCDPTSPRTMDGTTDGGVAWAGVRGCPTPSAAEFVQASPSASKGRSSAVPTPRPALSSAGAQIQTATRYPAPNEYTVEACFKSQGGSGGGQIVGMNGNQNGSSGVDDHSMYVDAWGHVDCYFYSSGWHRLVSRGSYTDGSWHLVQCAKGAPGMTLDIDGRLVASNTFTGPTLAYSGYWLIGYRRAGDGPRQSIIGDVGQVAIYAYALSQAQDANHWAVGQGEPSPGS